MICKSKRIQSEYFKIYTGSNGTLTLTGLQHGRAAYACKSESCVEKLNKGQILQRALKKELPEEDIKRIKQELLEELK